MKTIVRHNNVTARIETIGANDPDYKWRCRGLGRYSVTFYVNGRLYGGGIGNMRDVLAELELASEAHA